MNTGREISPTLLKNKLNNMGWSLGYNSYWNRYIGYGVVAYCDHPKCNREIDRGLSYKCGNDERGCGLYFCADHLKFRKIGDEYIEFCPRCYQYRSSYKPKPEHPKWINHLLTHESWREWRELNPKKVLELKNPNRP